MRLGQTSVIYVLAQMAATVIGFIGTIYFTRTLGEEVYGFYAITLSLVSWLGLMKTVGLGGALVKRMSEGEEPDAYLTAGILIKTVFTTVVILLVILFRSQINAYIGQPVVEFVVLILIASVFSGLVSSALQGNHLVHVYAPLSTGKELLRTVTMIILVFFGWGLSGMLFGHAVGTILLSVVGLWFIRPTFVMPEWRHVVSLFDFGKFAWLGNMRKKTFSDMDIIVLGLFVSAGLTGIYAIAYTLAKVLDIFGSAIQTTLFPELSKQDAQDNSKMVGTLTEDALSFGGLFLIPGIIGGTLLADRLLSIYGEGFEIGAPILSILLVGILAYRYTRQLLSTLNAIDRPDLAFRTNAVFISANLILNLGLVYTIGWVGAAIATATSATIGLVLGFHYSRQHIDFKVPVGEISRQWIAALVMGGAVYIARALGESHPISEHNTVFVVSLVGFGAAVYFIILLILSEQLRTTIDRNLPFSLPAVQ